MGAAAFHGFFSGFGLGVSVFDGVNEFFPVERSPLFSEMNEYKNRDKQNYAVPHASYLVRSLDSGQ